MNKPFVSVIIPCRNEEKFIGRALDSLILNDYPKDRMEILVIDGLSHDRTKEIVKSYTTKFQNIKIIDNPKKITPVAMNIGIKNARGELVTKTDAHSVYPKNYLSKCVRYLAEYNADAVGGVAHAVPSKETITARAIARSLTSFFGAASAFRTGGRNPQWADTAFGICYKKEVIIKAGLFNEQLARSQDMELNLRLKKGGGKILLVPDIVIEYHPKTTMRAFFTHNIADGIWAILPIKYGAPLFGLRHLLPLIFILGILVPLIVSFFLPIFLYLSLFAVILYLGVSFFASLQIALGEKQIILLPFLIMSFAARHFGYGIGSLIGLAKLII